MFTFAVIGIVCVFAVMIILGMIICATYPTIRDQPRDLLGKPIAYHKLPGYDHYKFAKLAEQIKQQQVNKNK